MGPAYPHTGSLVEVIVQWSPLFLAVTHEGRTEAAVGDTLSSPTTTSYHLKKFDRSS